MIIGFHGRLGSGKDTAGDRMVEIVDLPSTRISFAAKLKASAAALLDIDPVEWETYKNDPDAKILLTIGYTPYPMHIVSDWTDDGEPLTHQIEEPNVVREFTAREFLQRYGTESHRDVFGGDFWVEQALADYRYSPSYPEFAYVTDVRFANEAAAIRSLGGVIVHVLGEDEATGDHVSEAVLPSELLTFMIDNSVRDDDFGSLDNQLKTIAWQLGLPLKELSSR